MSTRAPVRSDSFGVLGMSAIRSSSSDSGLNDSLADGVGLGAFMAPSPVATGQPPSGAPRSRWAGQPRASETLRSRWGAQSAQPSVGAQRAKTPGVGAQATQPSLERARFQATTPGVGALGGSARSGARSGAGRAGGSAGRSARSRASSPSVRQTGASPKRTTVRSRGGAASGPLTTRSVNPARAARATTPPKGR